MLLDRDDVRLALDAFADEYLTEDRVPGMQLPDVVAFLNAQGIADIEAGSITVSSVLVEAGSEALAKDDCRLICRTVHGVTHCFWACE